MCICTHKGGRGKFSIVNEQKEKNRGIGEIVLWMLLYKKIYHRGKKRNDKTRKRKEKTHLLSRLLERGGGGGGCSLSFIF